MSRDPWTRARRPVRGRDVRMNADLRAMAPSDIPAVQEAERAAGERIRDSDEPLIARFAEDPIFTENELIPYIERGRAWVATERGSVVGFILVEVVDGCGHVEEVAVTPAAGRRGHGAALLAVAQLWAAEHELPAVTLSTF